MKHKPMTIAAGAVMAIQLLTTVGCATLAPTVETTANVYLLRAEFEQVETTLREVDFNDSERALVDEGLRRVNAVVDEFENIDTATVLATVLRTRATLDRIAGAYELIESTYFSYLDRNNLPRDPLLNNYGTSARLVHNSLIDFLDDLDDQAVVDPQMVAGYVGMILRILATTAI